MTVLTRTALAALALAVLSSCSTPDDARPGRDEGAAPTVASEQPHFVGDLVVTLASGRPIYSEDGCPAQPEPDRVCDESIDRAYLVSGQRRTAHLVEAETHVARGGLSWTTRLRFDPADGDRVVRAREDARATGARLLVLRDRSVLVAADVPDVGRHVIAFTRLEKPQAWEVVRRVVGAR